jgi:hypothetical protein
MHARNKKAQDMYKLLAHHIKHVSVWLLFFHPFSSYLDASKNGQRQPQQSLQQRLVQWKGLHWQWIWTVLQIHLLRGGGYLNAPWYVTMIALRAFYQKIPCL